MQPPSPSSVAVMPNPQKPGPQEPSSLPPPQQAALRCPRCDSANTKFCYYNNYSLSQPRHFCKTCRRYWTKGGSLRNIPIGGASRKSKKSTRSSSSTDPIKLFHPPNIALSSPFGDLSLTPFAGGLNFDSFSLMSGGGGGLIVSPSGAATSINGGGGQVASSIESLSAHNLELHWKMQQQRMAMLYGAVGSSGAANAAGCDSDNDNYQKQDEGEGEEGTSSFVGVGPVLTSPHPERPHPIFFQNLEVITNHPKQQHQHDHPHHLLRSSLSTLTGNGNQAVAAATEWFFDSSYGGSDGGRNDKSNGQKKESMNVGTSSFSNGGAQEWGDDQFQQINGLL